MIQLKDDEENLAKIQGPE